MTLPEVHLAGEALAALIDGELSRGAYHRALDHMARCTECRTAVAAQRQAKAALVGAGLPTVPDNLLSRLHEVPMTTDIGDRGGGLGGPGTLAVADGGLVWAPVAPPGTATPAARRHPRTRRHRVGRPRSYPVTRVRSVRLRRGLAGTLAGLAFGVVTAAAPLGSTGVSLQQPGVVDRGPQTVPASVGFGVNIAPRREIGTSTDRSVRPATDPLRGESATTVRQAAVPPG